MVAMASQITSLKIVYSAVYSRTDKKKPSKLRVTGLYAGNSPVTGEFSAQKASNAENIWWRHHVQCMWQDSDKDCLLFMGLDRASDIILAYLRNRLCGAESGYYQCDSTL